MLCTIFKREKHTKKAKQNSKYVKYKYIKNKI